MQPEGDGVLTNFKELTKEDFRKGKIYLLDIINMTQHELQPMSEEEIAAEDAHTNNNLSDSDQVLENEEEDINDEIIGNTNKDEL